LLAQTFELLVSFDRFAHRGQKLFGHPLRTVLPVSCARRRERRMISPV
jgi:hypothetical protein